VSSTTFHDHFSGHAPEYARYRPDYPESLFDFLASLAPSKRVAWDCATGSGQAAVPLARRFEHVVATDASERQIDEAVPSPGIHYVVAPAESAPLADGSVDLVTVAQALHWFDRSRFWREVERVLAPRGIVAAWCYGLMSVSPDVDGLLLAFYREKVGAYWPPERALVEEGYAVLAFPFEEIASPRFTMEKQWTLAELMGYVRTWSATKRFQADRREDPLRELERALSGPWGEGASRRIVWDVDLRVGRRGPTR
jgi:SAM-dependent methyltransferase